MPTKPISTPVERAWAKIDYRSDPTGCWPFVGAQSGDGYGMIGVGSRRDGTRRLMHVSRLILEQKLGRPLREGMQAAHRCDNPPCSRPSHLFEATPQQNAADCQAKGRKSYIGPSGERNGNAILTEAIVREIRKRVRVGEMQSVVAGRLGVSRATVCLVVSRKAWRHVL